MRIHLYYGDGTPSETLNEDLSGLTTLDKKHSGQKCVKEIWDVQFVDHPDYDMQIFCRPLVDYPSAPPPNESVPGTRRRHGR